MNSVKTTVKHLWHLVLKEAAKFGVVGGCAFMIDSGLYLLLLNGPLGHKTLTAKTISSIVATIFSYYANRHWTFKNKKTTSLFREIFMFFLMNGVAILISVLCLSLSHYVLGYTSKTADFISGNVVGLILGTIFRFFSYRTWVFNEELDAEGLESFEHIFQESTINNSLHVTKPVKSSQD